MWKYILLLLLITACIAPTPGPTPTATPTPTELPEVGAVSELPGAPTEVTVEQPEFSENTSVDLGSVI